MTVVRRFVMIQGNQLALYIDGKRIGIWDWTDDEENLVEVMKTIEYVRKFTPEEK